MALESKPVLDYCFTSTTLRSVLNSAKIKNSKDFSDVSDFESIDKWNMNKIVAVPEKFLNVTGTQFLQIKDISDDKIPSRTLDGN